MESWIKQKTVGSMGTSPSSKIPFYSPLRYILKHCDKFAGDPLIKKILKHYCVQQWSNINIIYINCINWSMGKVSRSGNFELKCYIAINVILPSYR